MYIITEGMIIKDKYKLWESRSFSSNVSKSNRKCDVGNNVKAFCALASVRRCASRDRRLHQLWIWFKHSGRIRRDCRMRSRSTLTAGCVCSDTNDDGWRRDGKTMAAWHARSHTNTIRHNAYTQHLKTGIITCIAEGIRRGGAGIVSPGRKGKGLELWACQDWLVFNCISHVTSPFPLTSQLLIRNLPRARQRFQTAAVGEFRCASFHIFMSLIKPEPSNPFLLIRVISQQPPGDRQQYTHTPLTHTPQNHCSLCCHPIKYDICLGFFAF